MDTISVKIGGNIEEIRSNKGITQEELALRIGVSRVSIVHIEQGSQVTKISRIYDIAIALGVELSDLIPDKKWYISNKGKKLKKVITYEIDE